MKKERKMLLKTAALFMAVVMVVSAVPAMGNHAGGVDANGIEIKEISGGLGVTAVITNTGTEDATDVSWSIYFCSGLVFIGRLTEGSIDIPAGEEATITSGFVFGFGPGSITVTAGDAIKIVSCFIFGPLILNIGPYPSSLLLL